MPVEIKVPTVGESITEGTIARWLKKDGEAVRAGDPIFELETEKATGEVPAPAAGTLRIVAPEGATVAVGGVVGRIEEGTAGQTVPAEGPPRARTPEAAPIKRTPAKSKPPEATKKEEPRLSPTARRLAAAEGVDVQQVVGTGRGGRITREDVVNYARQHRPAEKSTEAPRPAPQPAATAGAGRETRRRMSAIRQRIAQRLVAAQRDAAILTTFNEADLGAVIALRQKFKETFQKKHGVGLGFMAFFVKASIEALKAYPAANSFIEGDEIVEHHEYHIGIAVSTERGLMVPVVRDADRLSFAEVEQTIAALAQKARDGKISVDDLRGGTFTITNGGVFGSLLSTPLLNPPQSAILGMHTIQKRPVARDDQIVIRPMMYLALSYDHRLIDGREAVGFLVRLKECIENPERLLLEV